MSALRLWHRLLSGTLAAILLFSVAVPSHASFLDLDWGVRPAGMGGAFSAISDDANAPLFNPAGLVQVQWNEFSASYGRLFSGLDLYSGQDTSLLDQSYFAFAPKPSTHFGSWALSWTNFTASHLYREDQVMLSYAHTLGDLWPKVDNALAFGMNVKYLHRGVTLDGFADRDPVFSNGSSKSGATVDAGLLYKPDMGLLKGWRLSALGKNLTQPDMGFQEKDRVPVEWRLGAAYQSASLPWLVPAVDLSRRNGITGISAGAESWLFNDTIGLRGGVNRDEGSFGLSYYQAVRDHLGFRLDYAFTVPYYVEGTTGSHRLAITVYF